MLKFLLIATIIGVLLLSCIALLPLGCNTPFVKGRLTQTMLDSKQRTLSIDGDLSCSFSLAPAVVIHLGHAALSEHASAQSFASLDDMKMTLHLLPLLSGQIIIDGIELTGLKARLLRHRDGTLNFADLLGADKPDSSLPSFTIGGVHVSNADLEWQDETNGQTLKLNDLQLVTGRLANAAADALDLSARLQTAADGGIAIGIKTKARYDYDLTQKRFAIGKLEAQLNSPRLGNLREITLRLDADNLAGDTQSLKVGQLAMQFAAQTGTDGSGGGSEITGRLSSSLTIALPLPVKALELPDFSGELAIASPPSPPSSQKPLPPLAIAGPIRIDLVQRSAAGKFTGGFDDSRIAARVDLVSIQPLSLDFAIAIDKLDLDKYLPASREPGPGHASTFDAAALGKLDLHGTLDIGDLRIARAKMRNVRLAIRKTLDGRLEVAMPAQ